MQHIPAASPAFAKLQPLHHDPYLHNFLPVIESWQQQIAHKHAELAPSLADFALGHLYFGLHRLDDHSWVLREWAPNASEIFLYGDATGWQLREEYRFECIDGQRGIWQLQVPRNALVHGQYFALWLRWQDGNRGGGGACGPGEGRRLPSYAKRVVQDPESKIFSAQVWQKDYQFLHSRPLSQDFHPVIYEAHVGMSQELDNIGTYTMFRKKMLPYIKKLGYNTVQLMAIQEHPYYGSFGYHVANLFAVSSRFGSPEEFKQLVDEAHRLGLRVIIDLVHSHHVRNEEEGLGFFAGDRRQYFYEAEHQQWDSYIYDYGKNEVLHYLLSNLQFWLCEYQLDGFRFDGVTSMLYEHHGMGEAFGSYDSYFQGSVDRNAIVYLSLANRLIHEVHPGALTVAEDVSGLPGLAAEGLLNFDYRLAMGVTDYWFKLLDIPDDDWNMFALWHELSQGRQDERTISYVESHDQALVGGKTFIFTIIDSDMYWHMAIKDRTLRVDRGLALHKIARLLTVSSARHGYLNFMGNEFGHPEWIDFPREGNHWSYQHSRRQWSLAYREDLLYLGLRRFEEDMQGLLQQEGALSHAIDWLHLYDGDKVIAFRRGTLLFIFHLHPTEPLLNYRIPAPQIGEYRLVLCSDAGSYGGFDQIQAQQCYTVQEDDGGSFVRVYLPPRLVLVLQPKYS